MKQRTLAAQSGFERYTKKTRRAEFLEQMEQVVPWAELCALIEPVYPKAGPGRRFTINFHNDPRLRRFARPTRNNHWGN